MNILEEIYNYNLDFVNKAKSKTSLDELIEQSKKIEKKDWSFDSILVGDISRSSLLRSKLNSSIFKRSYSWSWLGLDSKNFPSMDRLNDLVRKTHNLSSQTW